jgi:DNA ligase-3
MNPITLHLCLPSTGWKPTPKTPSKDESAKPKSTKTPKGKDKAKKDSSPPVKEANKDDSFREFRRLCAVLSDTDSYTAKTAHVKEFFTKGTDGSEYKEQFLLYSVFLNPG